MIGLLSKDLSIIKNQLKILFIVLLFYGGLAYYDQNTMMFAYMVVLFGFFVPITALNYDERAQWNKYASCMPVKKSHIALSKYVLGFCSIIFGVLCYFILSIFISSTITINEVKNGLVMLSIGMAFLSLYLPVCFRFGSERARYYLIAICMLPTLIILILRNTGIDIPKPSEVTLERLINYAPLIAFVIVLISCLLSIHFINRKEY